MKKKQHYIWKYYLRSWTLNNKIWCGRNGKCFPTALENIGQKRFFYKAEPLNELEKKLVMNFINDRHPSSYEASLSMLNIYELCSKSNEYIQKTGIEDYHTEIEHKAIDIMKLVCEKDISWLECKKRKIDFSIFLGVQYSRTNRNYSNMTAKGLSAIKEFPQYENQFDPAKITKVFALLFGTFIGSWIYSSGKFSFIENNTDVEFITGDQPIFNLDVKNEFETPEKFNLYYPLTPKLALLISECVQVDREVSLAEVEKYNDFIESSSYEQIYSRQKEGLAKYT